MTPPSTANPPKKACGGPRTRWSGWRSISGPRASRTTAFFEQVKADGDELAAYVRKTTHDLETPDIRTAFANTYVEAHPLVAEELAWFEEYSAGFADEETADEAKSAGAESRQSRRRPS